MDSVYVGVDLGGTKIASVATDSEGRILYRDSRPTNASSGEEKVIDSIKDAIRSLADHLSIDTSELAGIGVGCPGPLSMETGIVYSTPNLKWTNVPLRDIMEREFGVKVILDNDANVAGLAEWRFGAGERCRNMVYVTVSTGVGGGLVIDGDVYRGSTSFAGEIGHITVVENGPICGCGKRGCLESLASGTAMANRAKEMAKTLTGKRILEEALGDVEKIDAKAISAAAGKGDPFANEIIDEAIRYLSIGLASIVTLLSPDRLVIGGGVTNIGDRFMVPLERMVRDRALVESAEHVVIRKASLGADVGSLGAVSLLL